MPANSQKLQPDYSQWPTKQQAADILQISTKSVEALANEGKLQSARWKRPTGGPKLAVYHPVDVEKQRSERFPGTESAFVMPAPSENSEKAATSIGIIRPDQAGVEENGVEARVDGNRILQLLAAFLERNASPQKLLETSEKPEKSQKPQVPLEHRTWLTVAEAAALWGRPQKHLRKLIASGALPANREGHTRVKRADLA